jgi:predicted glycosyltransferase
VPRKEQFLRASKAQELGLVHMLPEDSQLDAHEMATALRHLPQQPKPSSVVVPGLLDGRENVVRLARKWLASGAKRVAVAAEAQGARRGRAR